MAYHMAYRHTLLTKVHSRFEFQVVQSNPSTVQLLTSFTKKAIKKSQVSDFEGQESFASEIPNIKYEKQQQTFKNYTF